MSRSARSSVLANPVLVGAVTILVVVVAVFLAYNANSGLPFVPTFELKAEVPDGAKLVRGNEVREGGFRIGIVDAIEPTEQPGGGAGARLTLKLDQSATPIPADTTLRIRPRSALGLKYVELDRGSAADTLIDGSTISVGEDALAPELQEFFNIFDERTRENVQRNLLGFGNAFAGRGPSLNRALETLPRFLRAVPPVMSVLADEDTQIDRFFGELADAARVSAPIAEVMADGFAAGADTFAALTADREALKETISQSPRTLAVGTSALAGTRPFLRSLANVSDELRGAAAEVRRSSGPIATALRAGVAPLADLPQLNARLDDSFDALARLGSSAGAERGVAGLEELTDVANPLLRYLGPYVTVCNYWNYSWTFLADHITDKEQTGQIQRIQAKSVDVPPSPQMDLDTFGEALPAPGYNGQAFGAAVDENGNADCETGQRGFPRHLAAGLPDSMEIAIDTETPGNQGTTFTGRPRVLPGQTFDVEPQGAPDIRP